MEIKIIDVGLSTIETDFIKDQEHIIKQIYTAFQIPKSMWGFNVPMAKRKPTTLTRNQSLKYLKCKIKKK